LISVLFASHTAHRRQRTLRIQRVWFVAVVSAARTAPYNVDLPPNEQAQRCDECLRRRALNRLPRCALCHTDLDGAQPVFRVERSRFQSWRTKLNNIRAQSESRRQRRQQCPPDCRRRHGEPRRSLGALLPQVGNAARAPLTQQT
jgi:hypothetical protein